MLSSVPNVVETICRLNDVVDFKTKSMLWISGSMSIMSITRAQLKSNNTLYEFCTSPTMKAAYFLAALMNTVSYISLLKSCFTSSLDFNILIMDSIEDFCLNNIFLSVVRHSISLIFTVFFCSLSLLVSILILGRKKLF